MRQLLVFILVLVALSACDIHDQQELVTSQDFNATGSQTYSVLVGAEDPATGAEIEAYFPSELHIHPGDSVVWQQNASEIHTVTFSTSSQLPELIIPAPMESKSTFMFNPQTAFPFRPTDGTYDPAAYISSGLMGREQGEAPAFRLTFSQPGRYAYHCAVHGETHPQGVIVVEDPTMPTHTPDEVKETARDEIQEMLAQVPQAIRAAQAAQIPDEINPDGSVSHHILAGYTSGAIDLRSFFPSQITAHPGDKIVWTISEHDQAPHTITFLNGEELPPVAILELQPGSQPLLLINPVVANAQNADQPIELAQMINSGLLLAKPAQSSTYSLQLGDLVAQLSYICLFHGQVNMKGTIDVIPQ